MKAVWRYSVFCGTISGTSSASSRSPSIATQMRPRACFIMKAIASGVTASEATMISPSFSRFSSSTTTIMPPRTRAAIASSIFESAISLPFKGCRCRRFNPLGEQARDRPGKGGFADMSSSIRTVTVGSGIAPDLLTFRVNGSARGLPDRSGYRRWGISPRPENRRK
ncbi:Secreted protein (Modular protein) (plasmid) [Shinella sp. WSC3-e]|nr:Secreted protein (Modular protein) [Shinella sp. WSC3-e]